MLSRKSGKFLHLVIVSVVVLVLTAVSVPSQAATTGGGAGLGTGKSHTNSSGPFTCCPPCSTLNAQSYEVTGTGTYAAVDSANPAIAAEYVGPIKASLSVDASEFPLYLGPHGIYSNSSCTTPATPSVTASSSSDASGLGYQGGGVTCSYTGELVGNGSVSTLNGSCTVTDTVAAKVAQVKVVTSPMTEVRVTTLDDPGCTRDTTTGDSNCGIAYAYVAVGV